MFNTELIRRGDALKVLFDEEEYKKYDSETREILAKKYKEIIFIPAAPQEEMTAREFVKTANRICAQDDSEGCESCPINKATGYRYCCAKKWDANKIVPIVKQWAKEHPEKKRKTYAEDFNEHFGHEWNDKDNNWQCRAALYNNTPFGNCPYNSDCVTCWHEEMETENV